MSAGRRGWHSSKSPARPLPRLEQLENRLAPAVYQVNTLADTPLANPATGQDAAGQVSLRSAVAAANANPQDDTILMGSGNYALPLGELEVRGGLAIIGQGPNHTTLNAGTVEKLFAVADGDLRLSGLHLSGASAELIEGSAELIDCEITTADVGAMVAALIHAEAPVLPGNAAYPQAPVEQTTVLEAAIPPEAPVNLVGQPGGGAGTTDKEATQETGQGPHQSMWRGTPEKPVESAPEMPEKMPQSSAAKAEATLALDHTAPRPNEAAAPAMALEHVEPLSEINELWITRIAQSGASGQAILIFVVISLGSAKKFRMDAASSRSLAHAARRQRCIRLRPPRQSRRTRSPPLSGPPQEIKQGRQRCLPCSRLWVRT